MIFESCSEIRSQFSDYIDGACPAETIQSIRYHLAHCIPCTIELERYEDLQAGLHGLARQQVSPELALRLRVKVSQELHRKVFQRFMIRLENIFRPVLFPSVGGVLVAVICIGLMLAAGKPRVSNIPDVPLNLVPTSRRVAAGFTPPRIQELAPMNFDTGNEPVVLVTNVNAQGMVTSYKVLSGQHSPVLIQRLDRMMFYSLFQPATYFGQPTDGQLILSFRRITVRG